MGVGGQPHTPAASTPGKDSVPILQEGGWAPGPSGQCKCNKKLPKWNVDEGIIRHNYSSSVASGIDISYRIKSD